MFIQTEDTPNPSTLKFIPGRIVMSGGTADFRTADTAGRSPLAAPLFGVGGVDGVFLGSDFVSVTKAADAEWFSVKPAVLAAIMDHYTSGLPAVEEAEAVAAGEPDSEIVVQIKEILETRVRPPWRRMAATSCSTISTTASSTWRCTDRAPAARARPRR
jgi:hypothetical protein